MKSVRLHSAQQTREIGTAIGQVMRGGDVILLVGELGAGKTQLVQGIARGLGVKEPVTSPTFVLVQEHETASGACLHHADLYRVESVAEADDLAIDELVACGDMAVIEWGDRASDTLAQNALVLQLSHDHSDENTRVITPTAIPSHWQERFATALQAVSCS